MPGLLFLLRCIEVSLRSVVATLGTLTPTFLHGRMTGVAMEIPTLCGQVQRLPAVPIYDNLE